MIKDFNVCNLGSLHISYILDVILGGCEWLQMN